eukprot:TRINITY_DN3125_c0_g1_i3.p1 TRINITY_DN3125_c0_g1~~TRINITY_DN3125_c0_g1_i3.p1  ORF type:complete len:153 (+),score=11.95 TRINITY_DN3125_c0_g1_i3:48-506(+)
MTYAGGALPPHTFVVGPTAPHLQQGFPTAFGRQPAQHGSRGAYQPRGGGANNFRGGRGKRKGDYGHAHRRGGPSGGRPVKRAHTSPSLLTASDFYSPQMVDPNPWKALEELNHVDAGGHGTHHDYAHNVQPAGNPEQIAPADEDLFAHDPES